MKTRFTYLSSELNSIWAVRVSHEIVLGRPSTSVIVAKVKAPAYAVALHRTATFYEVLPVTDSEPREITFGLHQSEVEESIDAVMEKMVRSGFSCSLVGVV